MSDLGNRKVLANIENENKTEGKENEAEQSNVGMELPDINQAGSTPKESLPEAAAKEETPKKPRRVSRGWVYLDDLAEEEKKKLEPEVVTGRRQSMPKQLKEITSSDDEDYNNENYAIYHKKQSGKGKKLNKAAKKRKIIKRKDYSQRDLKHVRKVVKVMVNGIETNDENDLDFTVSGKWKENGWAYTTEPKKNVFTEPNLFEKLAFDGQHRLTRAKSKHLDTAVKDPQIEIIAPVVEKVQLREIGPDRLDLVKRIPSAAARKNESGKFAVIAEYDDILTNLFLDSFFLTFVTHKFSAQFGELYSLTNMPKFRTNDKVAPLLNDLCCFVRGICSQKAKLANIAELLGMFMFGLEEEIPQNLRESFAGLYDATVILKQALNHKEVEKSEFVRHAKKYLNMYHPYAGFDLDITHRYKTGKNESRLLATRDFSIGEELRHLQGMIAGLTASDEQSLKNRDFSVIFSQMKKKNCLFTGPARFVNHDCNPNVKFVALFDGDITFKVIQPISKGEEITCFYSESYFGEKNCDCLCESCERAGAGGFSGLPKQTETEKLRRKKVDYGFNQPYINTIGIYDPISYDQSKCRDCGQKNVEGQNFTPSCKMDLSIMREYYCDRCYRHQLIFDLPWPQRLKVCDGRLEEFATKILGGIQLNPISISEVHSAISRSIQVTANMLNVDYPVLVFVNPLIEGCWWPALVVPPAQRPEQLKDDEVLLAFFENPHQYSRAFLKDLRVFNPLKEPFKTFQKYAEFIDCYDTDMALKFVEGRFPDRLKWSGWKDPVYPIFKMAEKPGRKKLESNQSCDEPNNQFKESDDVLDHSASYIPDKSMDIYLVNETAPKRPRKRGIRKQNRSTGWSKGPWNDEFIEDPADADFKPNNVSAFGVKSKRTSNQASERMKPVRKYRRKTTKGGRRKSAASEMPTEISMELESVECAVTNSILESAQCANVDVVDLNEVETANQETKALDLDLMEIESTISTQLNENNPQLTIQSGCANQAIPENNEVILNLCESKDVGEFISHGTIKSGIDVSVPLDSNFPGNSESNAVSEG